MNTTGLFTNHGHEYDLFRPATGGKLPPATFVLQAAPMRGFYLSRVEDLPVPPKIYGARHDSRIMRAYLERAKQGYSTGVWLNGEKGSGKTMLASVLSLMGRELGMPTILIQSPFSGPQFNEVIEHLGRAVLLFDEFEKVYAGKEEDDTDRQDGLLTVFAGAVVAQHLYILTTNDQGRVSSAIRNRPGRMRYFLDYRGVTEDVVREYVEHNMRDASKRPDMISALKKVPNCNFDAMQCAVEEHNLFGGDVTDMLGVMNISREGGEKYSLSYVGTMNDDDKKDVRCTGSFHANLQDCIDDHDSTHLVMCWRDQDGDHQRRGIYVNMSEGKMDALGVFRVPYRNGQIEFVPKYGFNQWRQKF